VATAIREAVLEHRHLMTLFAPLANQPRARREAQATWLDGRRFELLRNVAQPRAAGR